MKTCGNCGRSHNDSELYCNSCGRQLPNTTVYLPQYGKRDDTVKWIAFAIVFAVIIVVVLGALGILYGYGEPEYSGTCDECGYDGEWNYEYSREADDGSIGYDTFSCPNCGNTHHERYYP